MPQITPNEGAWELESVSIIMSQASDSLFVLSILFNQQNVFHAALYLTDCQAVTKLGF